jgi:hypothetical protein
MCLRIHGFVFCKYNISLPCIFKRWETMLFPQSLMQEWQETGCIILFMTWHTLSVRTYRLWTIDVFPMVRSQYQAHDDSQARSDLKVLWWISDVVWKYISICQRRWLRIALGQRLLSYLVEIPQWERERDRKHHWSTTQHFEQLRSHPKGNHPLSVLWRQ